jgi:hypothetical protein
MAQQASTARRSAAPAFGIERVLLAAGLAATLATMLLVAKNQLAPLQRPLTFGLVFWGWFLVFYLALGMAGALAAGLLARLSGRRWLPRGILTLAVLAFLGAALGSNRAVLALLPGLDGPARYRWLVPAALLFSVLGLLGVVFWEKRAGQRLLAVLGAAAGLGALSPALGVATRVEARPPAAAPGSAGERLLVVGVDGADWDYIDALIARGDLPNLHALRQRGAWGELETLTPTLSPAIWTSIVTGKPPAEHGIKGFRSDYLQGVDRPLPRIRPVAMVGFGPLYAGLQRGGQAYEAVTNSTKRRVPAFWDIASARGSAVNVVSWWATWPAEPVLGSIVSEALHSAPPGPDGLPRIDRLTYPEALYRTIAPLIMRPEETTLEQASLFMDLTPEEYRAVLAREGVGFDRELTYYFSYFETTRRIVLELIDHARARQSSPPDTLLLFRIVDKMCHTSLADSELVAERVGAPEDRVRRYGRVVSAAYRAADRALGQIVSAFGEASVIVVSDHGFAARQSEGRVLTSHAGAPRGIFIAAGPPFRPGRVDGLTVYDIMPLLLYLKGFPVAEDFVEELDERVLTSEFLARHPVRRLASYGERGAPGHTSRSDPQLEAEALEHLRTLGYIQ